MNKVLLFGNPNVGKTTIFNALTNSNEKVSNFEGATIEQKSAISLDNKFELFDIPGTTSLSGSTIVEKVASDALIKINYDLLLDVIDITNLKRNLYLLIDLLETGKNVNVVLNMMDLFKGKIDQAEFERVFNINIIKTNREKMDIDVSNVLEKKVNNFKIDYGKHLEAAILKVSSLVDESINIDKRFIAIQYLKNNIQVEKFITNLDQANKIKTDLEVDINKNNEARSISGLFFIKRKSFIDQHLPNILLKTSNENELKWMNQYFDKIALHKFFGYVLFAFIMYIIFVITYQGGILQDFVDGIMSNFSGYIANLLEALHVNKIIESFILDGALAGITGVLVFIPQILIMFSLLTVLEAVGYFSRVSVLFDNIFDKLGLSSHSMIPYISGLGCNVIGIMSTRTIKDEKKRIATILTAPFISCSARLPVYIIFVDIFFKEHKSLVLFFLYFLGIFVAILVAFILDRFIYKSKREMTIFTLPKYKRVNFTYLRRMVTVKMKSYLNNAGKFIFIGSMAIWCLSYLGPTGYTTQIDHSFLGIIASKIAFVLSPLGFGTTRAAASLMSAFLAKELAISSMMVMYKANSINDLNTILVAHYDQASAMSFMVFTLLYIPCLSTLGAMFSELKQKRYVLYAICLSLTVGYSLAFIVYHIF